MEKLPAFLAAATFVVLALAVTHEWAYFAVVGEYFQTLLSPTDYLVTALWWAPFYLAFFAWMTVSAIFEMPHADKLAPADTSPPDAPINRKLTYFFILAAGIFGAFVPISHVVYPLLFVAFFSWAVVLDIAFTKLNLVRGGAWSLLLFTPMFFGICYAQGRTAGVTDLSKKEPIYLLRPNKESEPRPVVVLRNLDKGVIARNSNNDIEFHKWSDIAAFSHTPKIPSTENYACRFSKHFCRHK